MHATTLKKMQNNIDVVSVIRFIGAYGNKGRTSVFVIPGESDARRSEIPLVTEDPRAIRLIEWCTPDLADQVIEGTKLLMEKTGIRVVEVTLADD